jgi:hypothetical protein
VPALGLTRTFVGAGLLLAALSLFAWLALDRVRERAATYAAATA